MQKTQPIEKIGSIRRVLVVFIGSSLLFLFCVAIEEQMTIAQEKQTSLEELQQQLQEKRAGYEETRKREQKLLRELNAIEQTLQQYAEKLEEYRQNLIKNFEELEKTQTTLEALQKKYSAQNANLATRMRAIYKMGDLGYITPLLTISSQASMQQQIKYLQILAQYDVKLMKDAEEEISVILEQKAALEQRKRDIAQVQKDIEEQQRQIAVQEQQKMTVLKQIRQEKQQYAQAIQTLDDLFRNLEGRSGEEESSDEIPPSVITIQPEAGQDITFPPNLQEVIQSYGRHFRANKGKLLWPVQGRVLTQYGPKKIGGTTTFYKGVDIQAEKGTPFYAVFKGTVKYADWFEGYGNLVIVDHGGNYYTLYAHADQLVVKSGDAVDARQILGKVGDTDSTKGSFLYFEIRANGKPENPQTWLAKLH